MSREEATQQITEALGKEGNVRAAGDPHGLRGIRRAPGG